jgi:cytochrome P450
VISEMLGLPADRSDEVREWSHALVKTLDPLVSPEEMQAALAAGEKMHAYVTEMVAWKRKEPGPDLLSALVAVEDEGERLTTDELHDQMTLLYIAGHETTVNLIGNGVLALLRNPDELARWRDDPSLDAAAVDELLRYDGPVQQTVRIPMQTVRYDDVEVAAGTTVMTVLGAASHDPAMFVEPDVLRLDRANAGRHLGFAAGIHYCLGASLAKLEATVAITSVIRRFPGLALDGEPHWRDRLTIRGVDRLPLSW